MSSELNPENKCANLVHGDLPDHYPTIQQMFDMQLKLQKFYASKGKALDPEYMSPEERVSDIKEQWTNLTLEYAELMERLPFKRWRSYSPEDYSKAFTGEELLETKFEFIDCWHFFMNIGLCLGIDGEEFSKLYFLKNKENYARQKRGY